MDKVNQRYLICVLLIIGVVMLLIMLNKYNNEYLASTKIAYVSINGKQEEIQLKEWNRYKNQYHLIGIDGTEYYFTTFDNDDLVIVEYPPDKNN